MGGKPLNLAGAVVGSGDGAVPHEAVSSDTKMVVTPGAGPEERAAAAMLTTPSRYPNARTPDLMLPSCEARAL